MFQCQQRQSKLRNNTDALLRSIILTFAQAKRESSISQTPICSEMLLKPIKFCQLLRIVLHMIYLARRTLICIRVCQNFNMRWRTAEIREIALVWSPRISLLEAHMLKTDLTNWRKIVSNTALTILDTIKVVFQEKTLALSEEKLLVMLVSSILPRFITTWIIIIKTLLSWMLRMPSSLNTGWALTLSTISVHVPTTQCITIATWTSERTVPSGSCSSLALLAYSTCPTKSCMNKTDGPCGQEENTSMSFLLITISIAVVFS